MSQLVFLLSYDVLQHNNEGDNWSHTKIARTEFSEQGKMVEYSVQGAWPI